MKLLRETRGRFCCASLPTCHFVPAAETPQDGAVLLAAQLRPTEPREQVDPRQCLCTEQNFLFGPSGLNMDFLSGPERLNLSWMFQVTDTGL